MKVRNIIMGIMAMLFIAGCSNKEPVTPETAYKQIKSEYEEIVKKSNTITKDLEKSSDDPINVEPLMPKYNPLEDHIISFSMIDEDLRMILYSLAKAVGMNLTIDPEIKTENKLITLNFEEVSAASALEEIMGIYDIYYQIDGNIIRVKPFQEKIFKLNFLDTNVTTSFEIGGDVLGAGESSSTSELSGEIKMTGTGAELGNPYDVLEDMLRRIQTKDGKFYVNRVAGTLYVKDTPLTVNAMAKVVNHFKSMMAKQILIETRIIEISLSDQYQYGIDWSAISDKAVSADTFIGGSFINGITSLGFDEAELSIAATVDALKEFGDTRVISNPRIRTKHGKPSVISIGTSITYKKSETVTSTSSSATTSADKTIEISTLFDGLMLGVIPFIEEDNRITLQVNPIKSDVDRPSLEIVDSISLPKVYIKELSTTITMNNNEVVIIGGLIDKRQVEVEKKVPILSGIPILRYLFLNEKKEIETRELVIIMNVTVI